MNRLIIFKIGSDVLADYFFYAVNGERSLVLVEVADFNNASLINVVVLADWHIHHVANR